MITYRDFVCIVCKKSFSVPLGKLASRSIVRFCSTKCMGITQRGKPARNKLPIKDVLCQCGCGQSFKVREGSKNDCKRKFIRGHNSKTGAWNKGLDSTDPRVQKYSGKNNGAYVNGRKFVLYPETFTKKLKYQIRQRDNFTCQECGYTEAQLGYILRVHHIDYDKRNCVSSNLISLCKPCHGQTNFSRKDWTTYYQNKLSV